MATFQPKRVTFLCFAFVLTIVAFTRTAFVQASPVPQIKRYMNNNNLQKRYIPLSERNFTAEEWNAHHEIKKRALPGINDYSCKPSAEHPYPLILVHGLIANDWDNWLYMGPRFVQKGYCVFAIRYGEYQNIPLLAGLDRIENSAAQLAEFVDGVLTATGASEVDLVGHSQGSLMPRYYLKFLGGAAKVHKFAAFAPIIYGTTLSGIVPFLTSLGLYDPIKQILDPVCLACYQFLENSEFLTNLNAGGDTVPGVEYLFIPTIYDEIVTPYTNGLLRDENPLAKNKLLQDYCSADHSEHALMMLDPIVFNAVHAFLTPSADQTVNCLDVFQ